MDREKKLFAASADRNKHAILAELRKLLYNGDTVVELGSGTGQHVSYFSESLPGVIWQPTELASRLENIHEWLGQPAPENVRPPIELDVNWADWPLEAADFIYTCNTLHIVPEESVKSLFAGAARLLQAGGCLCAYGPFSFDGQHTASSNEAFDRALREGNSGQGIRDMQWLDSVAAFNGLETARIIAMPTNNFLAIWHYSATR